MTPEVQNVDVTTLGCSCRDSNAEKTINAQKLMFMFSSLFHPRTINNHFLGFQSKKGGGRTPLMGFLS